MRILILCGDATYNRGDRGNLASQIDLLRSSFPDSEIVYDSYNPQKDSSWYPGRAIPRGFKAFIPQLRELMRADVVVWGGGALLTDNASRVKIPYWCFKILLIKFVLRKKVMAWAHGIIIRTKLGAFFGRLVLNAVDVVTVRDRGSYDNLKEIGVNMASVHQTADPAVLLNPSPPEKGRLLLREQGIDSAPFLVAIPASFCFLHYRPAAFIPYMYAAPLGLASKEPSPRTVRLLDQLALFCNLLVERCGATILLLPTYVAPWEDDEGCMQIIKERSKYGERIHVYKGDPYGPKDYVSMFHHFNLAVSIPMHHNFFSFIANVPCINLYYEPKGFEFYKCLGALDWAMDINDFMEDIGPELLFEKTARLLSAKDVVWPKLTAEFNKLREEAKKNAFYLTQLVEKKS